MDLEEPEPTLRDRLDAIGSASRAMLPYVLVLSDNERAIRIFDLYGEPRNQAFAELLTDWRGVAVHAGRRHRDAAGR